MSMLSSLVITMIRPFEAMARLTPAELAVISAARTIQSYVRADATGELHLRQSSQMELEEIGTNGA